MDKSRKQIPQRKLRRAKTVSVMEKPQADFNKKPVKPILRKRKTFKSRSKKNFKQSNLNTSVLTKQDSGLAKASVSLDTTKIGCEFCPDAFNIMGLAIMSMMTLRAQAVSDDIYGAYVSFQYNNFANITGAQLTMKSNLMYISALFNCLRPKSIKTSFGEFQYSWNDFTFPGALPKIITIRGCNFYFYKPSANDPIATPQTCVPMNVASIEEANNNYTDLLATLTERRNLLSNVDYTSVKNYENDVSAMSTSSVYIGSGGCSAGGAYGSGENELPCSSVPILSQFCVFQTPSTRVSSFLRNNSGDACAAFGLPFLKDFRMKFYRSAHNVRYKFIDVAEIYEILVSWIAECYTKNSANQFWEPGTLPPLPLGGFIGAFLGTLRQYFAAPQSLAQFLTYDNTGQNFEPLRMGCNVIPKLGETMVFPVPLLEQIRYLHPMIFQKKQELAHNDKNAIIYVPVLGINRTTNSWTNPLWTQTGNVQVPLFSQADGYDATINWVDGTNSNGQIFNMNSAYFQGCIVAHNYRMSKAAVAAGPMGKLEGTPSSSTLPFTRIYNLTDSDLEVLSKFADWMRLPPGYVRRKVERVNSKGKKNEVEKSEYVVEQVTSGGSVRLYNQIPTRIHSLNPISEELANLFQYLILPSIIATDGGQLTSQLLDPNKLMVTYKERNYLSQQVNTNITAVPQSWGATLANNGFIMAGGVANQESTEYARVIDYMSRTGQGGFISDILGAASGIAGAIGV